MSTFGALVSLIGLATTSSSMVGAALGLYVPIGKRALACILAFAAGSLISALAIDLAYEGALELHARGFHAGSAWAFVGGGFGLGSVIYYVTSLFLDQKGAVLRSPTRFRDYLIDRKQKDAKELLALLAKCDLLRHLPPDDIESILPAIRSRHLSQGEILFNAGDPGDALFIVGRGGAKCLPMAQRDVKAPGRPLRSSGKDTLSARWRCSPVSRVRRRSARRPIPSCSKSPRKTSKR
ncbi:MAG TPA: cyclic nucleotide-binding domain-containing protein [Stellaceae bacterium]|nr:cyclic nucleotide-binding domain-containing protein [Stellaceae bacterium]